MGYPGHADNVIYNDTRPTMFSDKLSLEVATLTFNQKRSAIKCVISVTWTLLVFDC